MKRFAYGLVIALVALSATVIGATPASASGGLRTGIKVTENAETGYCTATVTVTLSRNATTPSYIDLYLAGPSGLGNLEAEIVPAAGDYNWTFTFQTSYFSNTTQWVRVWAETDVTGENDQSRTVRGLQCDGHNWQQV